MNQYLKCTEYIGDYYGIQPTAGGQYIVRTRDGRELSRWPTVYAAREDIQDRRSADEHERLERVQLWSADRDFSLEHPDLTDAQLRWQSWRDCLAEEIKRGSQDEILRRLYDHAMSLDATIKLARQKRNVDQLTELLILSERTIVEIDHVVRHAPDDAAPVLDRSAWISISSASELSGIPVKTLSSMIERGKLKSRPDPEESNPRHANRVLKHEIALLISKKDNTK